MVYKISTFILNNLLSLILNCLLMGKISSSQNNSLDHNIEVLYAAR